MYIFFTFRLIAVVEWSTIVEMSLVKSPHSYGRIGNSTPNGAICFQIDIFTLKVNQRKEVKPSNTQKKHKLQTDEDVVKLLENCDYTSLYDVKDTVAAFDKFQNITHKCIYQNYITDQSFPKVNNKTNADKKYCDTETNDYTNSALLCTNSTPIISLNFINTYYSTLGEKLATDMLKEMNTTESSLANSIETETTTSIFELTPTNENEILMILDSFKARNKSVHLSRNLYLKYGVIADSKYVLASPIAYICNLSLSTGIVPDSIKVAKVIPVFKSGDANNSSNYRPISLLNFMSKVLEKVVNTRLRIFLESNNILSEHQYGFRRGRSTKQVVAKMVEHITTKLDSRQKCIGIFLDLLKAFDTVSRPILFQKMEAIGIRGLALDWFKSYFENRKQRVTIGKISSDLAGVNFGLPQGSALGPILFLIYFNDLLQLNLIQTMPKAFADDAVLIIHGDTWKTATEIAQKSIDQVYSWLQNNLMSFNLSKTKFLAFSFSNQTAPDVPISIKILHCARDTSQCRSSELKQVRSTKYVGVIIDDNLSWSQHIVIKPKNKIT